MNDNYIENDNGYLFRDKKMYIYLGYWWCEWMKREFDIYELFY